MNHAPRARDGGAEEGRARARRGGVHGDGGEGARVRERREYAEGSEIN